MIYFSSREKFGKKSSKETEQPQGRSSRMQGCFQLKELALNFTYMTFAVNHDRDSELLLKRKLNYLDTEALFQTEESEFATTAYHEKMHRLGLFTWSNAIVFKYITVHSAGHTDDISIAGDPDNGWGYLANLGYNMIQTDWVGPCIRYLKEKGYR